MSKPTQPDVKLSPEQMTFIDRHLSVNTSSIVEARDQSLYSILLFNPLQEHGAILTCPSHGHQLHDTGIWTHMRRMANRRPRHLYHLRENVLLISSIYACSACGDDYDKETYMAHPEHNPEGAGSELSDDNLGVVCPEPSSPRP